MTQDDNRAQQQELYGAPLSQLVGGVTAALGISQARVAALIGVSAPMLSQLVSAHRVKLGNPVAVARLQRLIEVSAEVRGGRLTAQAALEQVAGEQGGQVLTRTTATTALAPSAQVQHLLRSVASATDLLAAADLVRPAHPEIAEFLAVYGAGRADEAESHYRRVTGGSN
ncbi:MAG: DNA-binding protein [Actinomycetales bacterium]